MEKTMDKNGLKLSWAVATFSAVCLRDVQTTAICVRICEARRQHTAEEALLLPSITFWELRPQEIDDLTMSPINWWNWCQFCLSSKSCCIHGCWFDRWDQVKLEATYTNANAFWTRLNWLLSGLSSRSDFNVHLRSTLNLISSTLISSFHVQLQLIQKPSRARVHVRQHTHSIVRLHNTYELTSRMVDPS